VRHPKTNEHVPHYLIPPNSPLPASFTQHYGTVRPGQRRVRLRVVQAGPTPDAPLTELGDCVVAPLPEGLPENAPIAVTLSLDDNGLVHTTAIEQTGGVRAEAKIVPDGKPVASPSAAKDEADTPAPAEGEGEDDPVSIRSPGESPQKPLEEKPTTISTAPPPAPSRTGTEADEGESEFWQIVAPEVKKARRKRRSSRR